MTRLRRSATCTSSGSERRQAGRPERTDETHRWRRCSRASVRAAESVLEVLLDATLDDRVQQTPNRSQMLLPQQGELDQQLRRPADVRQVLIAIRKGEPVVAGKRDSGTCRGGSDVVLEREISRPPLGLDCRSKAGNETLLGHRRLQKQHRV